MGLKDTVGKMLGTLLAKPGTKAPKRTSTTKPTSSSGSAPGTPTTRPSGNSTANVGSVDGVAIEYSPLMDGDPDPGEVVWTWVPYEDDPNQGKDRPVVVVGRKGSHLAGVALTSKDHDRTDSVEVGTGAWDSEGRPSYAKIDRILDIDPDAVRREGAILDKARFDTLVKELAAYHGSSFGG